MLIFDKVFDSVGNLLGKVSVWKASNQHVSGILTRKQYKFSFFYMSMFVFFLKSYFIDECKGKKILVIYREWHYKVVEQYTHLYNIK